MCVNITERINLNSEPQERGREGERENDQAQLLKHSSASLGGVE